jgi:hypothetical protein
MTEPRTHLPELLTRQAIRDGRLTRARIVRHADTWAGIHLGARGLTECDRLVVARAPAGLEKPGDFYNLKNPYLEYVQVGASGFLLYVLHTYAWQHRVLVPLHGEDQRGFAMRACADRPSVAYMFEHAPGGVLHQFEHVCSPSRLELIFGPKPASQKVRMKELHEALILTFNPAVMSVKGLAQTAPLSVALAVSLEDFCALHGDADELDL